MTYNIKMRVFQNDASSIFCSLLALDITLFPMRSFYCLSSEKFFHLGYID